MAQQQYNGYNASQLVSQQQHPQDNEPSSPPRSTKNVSFNTRDKIHQWDDQLELLKHVDEAFFGAAQYLLEDVHNNDVDCEQRNQECNNATSCMERDDDDDDDYGILRKLFRCGDNTQHTNNTADDNNNTYFKPYLGIDGTIIDDGTATCTGIIPTSSPSIKKKSRFTLTDKLLEDFKAAVEYRMQNILSSIDDNNADHVETEEDVKTREIAWKMEAYGLPKVWKKNECQEHVVSSQMKKNTKVDEKFKSPSARESLAVSSCHENIFTICI